MSITLSKFKYIFCYLTLLLFLPSSLATTFNVVLYNGGNPPYSMVSEHEKSGIFIDIFDRLSQLTGYKFNFTQLPVARGLREFNLGNIDIEPGINKNWRLHQKEVGLFTIPYASSVEVLFGIKHKDINTAVDLYGNMVGVVRGYSYQMLDDHFGKRKIVKVENKSENELLKQLSRDHLDYICIGDITAKYYQLLNPKYRIYEDVIELGNSKVSLRLHPKNKKYLEQFNQALSFMVDNNEIKEIYDKYSL
jgi:polar amino acid transport system substrate-binding protein